MRNKSGIVILAGIFLLLWLTRKKIKAMFAGKEDYIKKMLPVAKAYEAIYKIPHLFILAQTALETGYGKHLPGWNFAGVKAKKDSKRNPIEPAQLLWTYEHLKSDEEAKKFPAYDLDNSINGKYRVKDWFKVYNSAEEGLKGYLNVLMKYRYKSAFQYSDPILFAAEIKNAGYATDPKYLFKIKENVEEIKKIIGHV